MKPWLVEIRLKDWEPSLPGNRRIVDYVEVLAGDEIAARHAGFDVFETRCRCEPATHRKMAALGITLHNCCAPDAVAL